MQNGISGNKIIVALLATYLCVVGFFVHNQLANPGKLAQDMNLGGGTGTITQIQQYIATKDEGSTITPKTASLNFVGAGVTATNVGNDVTVTIGGGSGSSPLTTKGDLYTFSSSDARLPVGTDGQVLASDSTQTTGLKWVTATGTAPAIGGTLTSGTAGSVLFSGSAVFAQDNSNFFWDNTNKRLGIGTNTPASKLDIVFNNTSSDGFTITNTNAGAGAQIQNKLVNDAGSFAYYGISSSTYSGFVPLNGGKAFFGSNAVDTSIFTQTAKDIIFYPFTVEAVRFASGGNVTIQNLKTGSTAPTTTGTTRTVVSDSNGLLSFITTPTGTVTAVSVASANGFTGSSSGGATPALTLATSVTGLLKGNGTAISAASAGTDYQAPITLTTTGTSGAATFVSNTLNIPQYAGTTYSAGTGLTLTTGTFSVNTSQNIATLSNLTSNGLVTTSGGTGALSVTVPATGILTFLGTPSSANLAAAVTDETGSGALVFATSPSFTTPSLGAATASGLTLSGVTGSTQCLQVNSSGVVSGTGSACGSGSSGIVVGTTTVTSGTNTKVLFNNAGVVGEYTISGTGNVAMTTSPTFTTPALGTPSALVGTNITGTATGFTAGTATNAVNVGVTDDTTTNASMFPTWVTANTGNLPIKTTSTKLSFNPSTGRLTTDNLTVKGSSAMIIGVASSNTGAIQLQNSTNSNAVTLQSGISSANYAFTLPVNGGTSGYALTTDGSGTTSWTNITGGTLPWTTLSSNATATIAVNNNYIASTGTFGNSTLTLPTSCAVGDSTEIITSNGVGGTVKIAQNTSQTIVAGSPTGSNIVTTSGTSGFLLLAGGQSLDIKLVCTTANTTWRVTSLAGGTATTDASVSYTGIGLDATGLTGTIATLTNSQTFTNKSFTSSTDTLGGVTMTLGSDANYDMYYRNSSGILTRLANGTTGQFLAATTSAAPSWGTPSGSGTVTATGGSLTSNAVVLGAGTTDTKVSTGITTNGVSQLNLGVNATTIGTLKMFGNTSGDVTLQPAAVAGTATSVTLPSVTSTLYGTGSGTITSSQLATSISDETGSGVVVFGTSPTLVTPALGTPTALVGTNITGTGASFTSGLTLALKSATTSVDVSSATAPSGGQVLTATSSTAATWQTPSSGTTWTEVTGTTQTAAVNNGYITNNAGLVTVTLPSTAAVGQTVSIVGKGAGGWKVAQNASGKIHFATLDSTTGTGGFISSSNRYDSVELICIVANNEWVVRSSIGSITVN